MAVNTSEVKAKASTELKITDDNGNETLVLKETASAVNEVAIANAASTNGPTISSQGGDTNVDLNLAPKGTGAVKSTSKVMPAGDTAAGDDAAIGYTAAEGLILTGQGSTSDITIKNDADADVLTVATGTTNVDIVGDVTAATLNADGDTAAGDNAAIGYTAAEGLILTGQGSTNDVTIKNDADTAVIQIPTGGTGVTMAGTLGVTGAVTANAGVVIDNITIDGTEIDLSSGDLLVDVAGDITLDAGGGDVKVAVAGTDILAITNSSSDVVFQPQVDAKDLKFNQYDGRTILEVNDAGYVAIANGATGAGELRIYEDSDNGSNYIGFKASAAMGADIDYVLPAADGSSGQQLTTNGSGVLSWAAAGAGGSGDGSMTTVKLNDSQVGNSDIVTLDFSSNFTATESPDTEIQIGIAPAQTTITSILATDLKIGEDDQTKIDFETNNAIHFYADNHNLIALTDANDGDAVLTVPTADKNFTIKGTDDSSAITALDIDMAAAGAATFNSSITLGGGITLPEAAHSIVPTARAAGSNANDTTIGAQDVTAGSGTANKSGGNLVLVGGLGTGNAAAGKIKFRTSVARGSSDNTAHQAVSTRAQIDADALSPGASDGLALGTTSLMWADLFLASGGVVNFNNGDVTLTHSSNTMTLAGGGLDITHANGITLENDETITNSTNGEVLINGTIVGGNGSGAATIESNGDHDLVLQTGNSTTGNITIVDGGDGDIQINPNGTGGLALGDGILQKFGASADAKISYDASANLLQTVLGSDAEGTLITSATADKGRLTIQTTDSGAGAGALILKNNGGTGANNDSAGSIDFQCIGGAGNTDLMNMAGLKASMPTATSGDEIGKLQIQVCSDGQTSPIDGIVVNGTSTTGRADVTLGLGAASVVTVPGTMDIAGAVDIAGDLTLSAGGDGALNFGTAGENSIKIPDNQAKALVIEEANNQYMRFSTTNDDGDGNNGNEEYVGIGGATTHAVWLGGAADTPVDSVSLVFGANGDMLINHDGNSNIETASGHLDIKNSSNDKNVRVRLGNNNGDTNFQIQDSGGTAKIKLKDSGEIQIDGTDGGINFGTDGAKLKFGVGNTEVMQHFNDQGLHFNSSVASASDTGFQMVLVCDDGAAMAAGHRAGALTFRAAEDAAGNTKIAANIEAFCEVDWSSTENASALAFTTTTGNDSQTEKLRITSGGALCRSGAPGNAGNYLDFTKHFTNQNDDAIQTVANIVMPNSDTAIFMKVKVHCSNSDGTRQAFSSREIFLGRDQGSNSTATLLTASTQVEAGSALHSSNDIFIDVTNYGGGEGATATQNRTLTVKYDTDSINSLNFLVHVEVFATVGSATVLPA